MNRHLKGFIASVVIIALCTFVTIATFAQGVWYGVFPLALGIFFLIKFAIPSWREYKEETTPKKEHPLIHNIPSDDTQRIRINRKEPTTQPQQLELARGLLTAHFLDLGEETARDIGVEKVFDDKRDIIQLKIRSLIEEQERLHGSFFLVEDTETNTEAKSIATYIGKHSYSITIFYLLGYENTFPNIPFNDVIRGMVDLFDEDMENNIFDEAKSRDNIALNNYLVEMIHNKIREGQGT